MEITQKQAMHVETGKSFGTAEANENERRWDNKKIDAKNQVPTNHYDKTRMHLNFEIGEDRKVHPLGYHKQNLDKRLEKRPGEDDDSYARCCLLYASQQVSKRKKNGLHR